MSGHPHKGKRSEWRNVQDSPPALQGAYELRCCLAAPGIWVSSLRSNQKDWPCPACEYRGLAEEPK